ncbi:dihydroorotase [Helicobacter sp. 16-1353]|uniref:dihydroorotase n=1 Tax=Helicobacter sp. 16-1353 TaxID=2004996 RepID=UPI000DCC7382|nr:dihydroorotase [Helicobacter sp. 16-1353]RAX54493.1 dihydroorotase [Helicobacter sp. 16-1353]
MANDKTSANAWDSVGLDSADSVNAKDSAEFVNLANLDSANSTNRNGVDYVNIKDSADSVADLAESAIKNSPDSAPDLILKNPLDMHIHLREGEVLEAVLPFSARYFSSALAMPNLKTPLLNTNLVMSYKAQIEGVLKTQNLDSFKPTLSLYVSENLDKNELLEAQKNGIRILKLYPKGATTGSESGVSEILNQKIMDIFEMAEEMGFILSIHGESNGFCMEREFEFGAVFAELARTFPRMKIIMEHLSDRRSIPLLERCPNLFATLTLHHISMSLDDVLGAGLNPHFFCKPMLKTPQDRDALLELALNAHPKVSFGSDSAPHLESAKLAQNGSAGIFSAPILIPRLCEIFEANGKLENLQKFISDNAIKIYDLAVVGDSVDFKDSVAFADSGDFKDLSNLGKSRQDSAISSKDSTNFSDYAKIPAKTIKLIKGNFKNLDSIKTRFGHIIPLLAGANLSWKIQEK